MYKFKTHQTEFNYKYKRDFVKKSSVRSGQTMPLRQLVESAQRGSLPDSVTFNRLDSNGYIPPQYDRSHISERFNRMKSIASELNEIRNESIQKSKEKSVEPPKSTDVKLEE